MPTCRQPRAARLYLGYSDAGFLHAGFHKAGLDVAWGPMPQDVLRDGGEAAVNRALDWLVRRDPAALEPALDGPAMAFNLTVLSNLLGTPLEPDFSGVDLLIEDVGEHLYRIDRSMFHVTASPAIQKVAPDPPRAGQPISFPTTPISAVDEAAIVEQWCGRSGIPFGGRADIGHDAAQPGRSVSGREIAEFPSAAALQSGPLCALLREEQQEGQDGTRRT